MNTNLRSRDLHDRRAWPRRAVALGSAALLAIGLLAAGPVDPASAVAAPTWSQLSPTASPPALVYATMAYDPTSQKLVLFGGQDSSWTYYSQTWTFDGSTWTDVSPATSPPARAEASMVYDAAMGKVVLFGGDSDNGYLNDTWTYDAGTNTWTELTPSTSPPARVEASMAYDGLLGEVVLFGGDDGTNWLSDTWTFDGSTWTEQPVTGPSARFGAGMAYDPDIGQVVLFGGYGGESMSDTWTYDGTWTQQSPAVSPPSRRIATMAYDPALHQVLLYGGFHDQTADDLGDTWTYDGSAWTEQFPATNPGLYEGAVMDYDQATGQMILFGGYGGGAYNGSFRSDTWAYAVPTVYPPDAPAAPAAVPGNGQVTLTWSAPTNNGGADITAYEVAYRPTGSSGTWSTATPSPATNTSVTVTGLANGTSYDFEVRAYNSQGWGEYSPVTSATPSTVPSAPGMPNLVSGNGEVTVSWSEPPNGGSAITGYTVAYRDSTAKGNRWSTVTSSDTSLSVTGLTNHVQYFFKVLASNANGSGPYSPEAAAAPFAANAPGVPTGVTAGTPVVEGRTMSVPLSWTNSGPDADRYLVTVYAYRAGSKGTPTYREIDSVTVLSASPLSAWQFSGLSLRKDYAFSVSAGNADGWSVPSTPSNAVGG